MLIRGSDFRRSLLTWFRRNGRDLPWRRTRDPYAVLVSELMLQQTTVAAVIPHFERWIRRFPDVKTLATASESEVLHAWQGLGYYARARNLHAAAKRISRNGWPADLLQLPGVGRYTANAVATFAFEKHVPVVETNTARLLARLTNQQEPIDTAAGRKRLWAVAASLQPDRDLNAALMDLGATICTARDPKCSACPVKRFCTCANPAAIPRQRSRTKTVVLTENHQLVRRNGSVLLEQSQTRWRGMWILPRIATPPETQPIHTSQFPFTHHRITLAVHEKRGRFRRNQRWFRFDEVDRIPIPSPHRRALKALALRAGC